MERDEGNMCAKEYQVGRDVMLNGLGHLKWKTWDQPSTVEHKGE